MKTYILKREYTLKDREGRYSEFYRGMNNTRVETTENLIDAKKLKEQDAINLRDTLNAKLPTNLCWKLEKLN